MCVDGLLRNVVHYSSGMEATTGWSGKLNGKGDKLNELPSAQSVNRKMPPPSFPIASSLEINHYANVELPLQPLKQKRDGAKCAVPLFSPTSLA
jgi:hypothetical protein